MLTRLIYRRKLHNAVNALQDHKPVAVHVKCLFDLHLPRTLSIVVACICAEGVYSYSRGVILKFGYSGGIWGGG